MRGNKDNIKSTISITDAFKKNKIFDCNLSFCSSFYHILIRKMLPTTKLTAIN